MEDESLAILRIGNRFSSTSFTFSIDLLPSRHAPFSRVTWFCAELPQETLVASQLETDGKEAGGSGLPFWPGAQAHPMMVASGEHHGPPIMD